MGDVVAAVDRYTDIPAATLARLKARMAARDYDEVVRIERDAIVGKAQYSSEIRQMHFGTNRVCNTVTRASWTQTMQERGLVYCEEGQCIIVPTVCRNVSRITRTGPAGGGGGGPAGPAIAAADPQTQLEMDPTGAGVPATGAPGSFAQGASGGGDPALAPGGGIPALASNLPVTGAAGGRPLGPILSPFALPNGVPFLPPGVVTTLPNNPVPPAPVPGIPEPQGWAMLVAGLFALAAIARHRKAGSLGS
jgi:hypothetical protein